MKKTTMLFAVMLLIAIGFAALGNAKTITSNYNIKVRNASTWDTFTLIEHYVNQIPDPAEPGGYVDVRFKVENIGSKQLDDFIFELLPQYPFSLEAGDSAVREVGTLFGRQTDGNAVILHYRLKIDKNAVEGDNNIRLRYSVDNGVTWIMLDPFKIRIQTHDAILSVERVTNTPDIIPPGGSTDMLINIKNNADSYLKNIKLSLELIRTSRTATVVSYEELPFSPVGSTNEVVIPKLSAKASKNVHFNLISDPDTESDVYKINLNTEYQDHLGNNYSKTNVVSLVVGDTPDMSITLDSTTIKRGNSVGEVVVRLVNKGLTNVKFVNMIVEDTEGYDIITAPEVYIGNIESDDYETADFDLYVGNVPNGNLEVPLKVTYKDANNEDYEEDVKLSIKIYTKEEIKRLGLEKKSSAGIIITIIILMVGGWIGYRKWRKWKKKKSLEKKK